MVCLVQGPTMADLLAPHPHTQLLLLLLCLLSPIFLMHLVSGVCLLQGPTMAELLAPHPHTQAWLQRVRDACAPHYEGMCLPACPPTLLLCFSAAIGCAQEPT